MAHTNKVHRVGTRRSPLALSQVEEVLGSLSKLHPDLKTDVIGIDTYGDKDTLMPISEIEGTDFFTKEIEEALLKGEIDFAVHSAKDLPDRIPDGLCIAAITESIDPYDALVSRENLKIDELPKVARIGTSSARRKSQLKSYRPDFELVDIRGNIEERLRLLDDNTLDSRLSTQHYLDAIVIAACALVRLDLTHRITQRIPFEILNPHPLQGALALETREDDKGLIKLLSDLNTYDIAFTYKMS